MDEANIDIARRAYQVLAERGELARELVADDFEFDPSGVMPDMSPERGIERADELFRSYAEMFEEFSVTLEQVVAAEGDRVVTAVRDGGRVKGSGANVTNRFFHVFVIRDGRIARWSSHPDRETALKAAAIGEPQSEGDASTGPESREG